MSNMVTLGTYGHIGPLLNAGNPHPDLTFLTRDGMKLKCHRFVIGAQSAFLKALLLSLLEGGGEDPLSSIIHLPDVDSKHMRIVLEFLYTGCLVIEGEDVSEVKGLMSQILCLDARVSQGSEGEAVNERLLMEEELDEPQFTPSRPVIKSQKMRKRKKRIRKYSFCPFTITGVYKASTLRALNQESGTFTCKECDITYDKEASLRRHRSRTHNTNLREECPICRKRLATKSTLSKHLISHQPRSQWPFECPLCKQEFQCKADIPKHLMTSKHKDVQLPSMGSEGWIELINSSARSVSPKYYDDFNSVMLRSGGSDEEDPLSL
ncbi:Putative LOC578691 [Caligus rogercresseyi]|uniref:LOC578691 n=1 Tax=Caligus rogercresseyi TaxID=217165 RepID=A0A7T8JVJ8_CALRO|nr:Putative LOC578691 [Caligus rogercresseyi]